MMNSYLPYFKGLGVTGIRYQALSTIATMPWATKAAIGLLSDSVPLFGYHKRSYIVILSIVGTCSLIVLGSVPLSTSLAFVGAILLLLVNLNVATVDLLTEGMYAELMVNRPDTGSDIVSFAWGLKCAGAFIGCIISAVMTSAFTPRLMFFVTLPLAAQVILPTVTGWFPEHRLLPANRGIRHDKIAAYPNLFKLSVVMTIGAIIVGASAFGRPKLQSSVSIAVAVILALFGYKWLPNSLRPANLYLFLNNVLYLSIAGVTDYWYTADHSCVPDGPNFSMTFYVSFANLVSSLASVAGVILFQMHFSRGKFRTAFLCTNLLKVSASFFDYFIVKRYNKRLGISDRLFFAMGDAVVYQVITRIEVLPAVVLTSKVCPPGMEASVFALLVSFQNLGQGVAQTIGDELIEWLGIRTVAPCNFDYLPTAILIAHVAVPTIMFPLIFILIPDARMTDDLVNTTDARPTSVFAPAVADDFIDVE